MRDHVSETTHQAATQEDIAEPSRPLAPMASNVKSHDTELQTQINPTECIDPTQLESDPVLLAEYARFDSLVTSGPTIESYRGLSSLQL